MNYPKYSDLRRAVNVQNRIAELRQFIEEPPSVRTGSLFYAGGNRTHSKPISPTEYTALKIAEAREELAQLIEEDRQLFKKLNDDIRSGTGDDAVKDLIVFVYLYGIPVKRAAKMAGVTIKRGQAMIEEYMKAARAAEEEENNEKF